MSAKPVVVATRSLFDRRKSASFEFISMLFLLLLLVLVLLQLTTVSRFNACVWPPVAPEPNLEPEPVFQVRDFTGSAKVMVWKGVLDTSSVTGLIVL